MLNHSKEKDVKLGEGGTFQVLAGRWQEKADIIKCKFSRSTRPNKTLRSKGPCPSFQVKDALLEVS